MRFNTCFLFFFLSVIFAQLSFSQQAEVISSEVISAIKKGDSESLADGFFTNIEIVLPAKTGVYSKTQAEMVMKDFFSKYPVKDFNLIHTGKKENASFAIANYSSVSHRFRFTFLTKSNGSKVLIHQLRIEKQDE
jgi:hypothetical protein